MLKALFMFQAGFDSGAAASEEHAQQSIINIQRHNIDATISCSAL